MSTLFVSAALVAFIGLWLLATAKSPAQRIVVSLAAVSLTALFIVQFILVTGSPRPAALEFMKTPGLRIIAAAADEAHGVAYVVVALADTVRTYQIPYTPETGEAIASFVEAEKSHTGVFTMSWTDGGAGISAVAAPHESK